MSVETVRDLKRHILRLADVSITPNQVTELIGLVSQLIYWEGEDACIMLYKHGQVLARKKANRARHEATPNQEH